MKVLIISHNPVSDQSNMGKTFLSLFSAFDREELCQLYIYPTVPNRSRCSSCYRVTDKEALSSLLWRREIGGEIPAEKMDESQGIYERSGDEALYRSRKNKSALRRLLRDGVWKLAPWYNRKLRAWLDREKPQCIFVAPGAAGFLYDFALRISAERRLPIVTYICDDYYFAGEAKGILERFRLGRLRKKIRRLMEKSAHLAVISRELEKDYSARFGVDTTLLMTGAGFSGTLTAEVRDDPTALSYFGNIRCGRYTSLAQIGQALDEINRESGTDYRLKIYSPEKDPQILGQLRKYASVELCGFVTGERFTQALGQAELLLHTEAFDSGNIGQVRYSVSTKIADSLASGIALVAYGPEEVSSMRHLLRHDCALAATDRDGLKRVLLTAFTDRNARERVVRNALATARAYHDSAAVSAELRRILTDAAEKGKKKILLVNNFYGEKSTGKITALLHRQLRRRGYEVLTVFGRGANTADGGVIRLCPEWYAKGCSLLSRITGLPYGGCLLATRRLMGIIRRERPDVVHLQCVNGNFVNIYRLVDWLKRRRINTVVSLHAEFMYTANCAHAFDCRQWQHGCTACPDRWKAVKSRFFDRTGTSWKRMRRAFAGYGEHCVICPVSDWTKDRARQSDILKELRIHTVYNGVDTERDFRYCETRQKQGILHVTAHFSDRREHPKGGWYLLELAKRMPGEQFLVAGPAEITQKLPVNVILLGEIRDQQELAQYYRRAKLTVLVSQRETFSMPCAESLCCGTPVAGFRCGGAEEIALPEYSTFTAFGDLDGLEAAARGWLQRDVDGAVIAARAAEKYSAAGMAERCLEVYRSFDGTQTD